MPIEDFRFSCPVRVRVSECDQQSIVFNGAYLDYVEVGQAAYFRNLGVALYDDDGRRVFDTAIVKATLEYLSPARVDDVLRVFWKVDRIGGSSLTARCEIRDGASGKLLMRAEIIYVNYDSEASSSRPVSDDMRRLIETYEDAGEVVPLDELPGLAGLARAIPTLGFLPSQE